MLSVAVPTTSYFHYLFVQALLLPIAYEDLLQVKSRAIEISGYELAYKSKS